MNILDAQPRICLIEPDGSTVGAGRKVYELLQVFTARRWRRVFCEFENKIENGPDVFSEINDIFIERAVIHRKEPNLVVLQRYELGEMRRAYHCQVFLCLVRPGAQKDLYFHECKTRLDRQNDKE